MMATLRSKGKWGAVLADFLDHFKSQISTTLKHIGETGLGGLEKIIKDIGDDLIKIIQGGHVGEIAYEENTFNEVWEQMMATLRSKGKWGAVLADFLDHFKSQISTTLKHIGETGLGGLEKIIKDIGDDLIKIIQGGHVGEIAYEENTFDEAR